MSRRTEHEEDVIINQDDAFLDDETEVSDDDYFVEDIQGWDYWHQDHLLNMYMSLREYCEDNGLHFTDTISFHMFCEFLYAHGTAEARGPRLR